MTGNEENNIKDLLFNYNTYLNDQLNSEKKMKVKVAMVDYQKHTTFTFSVIEDSH